jgi:hypothetical protein
MAFLPKLLIRNLKNIRFQNKEDRVSGKTRDIPGR